VDFQYNPKDQFQTGFYCSYCVCANAVCGNDEVIPCFGIRHDGDKTKGVVTKDL
jgi:hypothetical protein